MFEEELRLAALINLEDWQSIQDSLSEVLEISLRTFSSDGKLLTKTSRSSRLCNKIFPKISKSPNLCFNYLLESAVKNLNEIKNEVDLKIPFNLDIFVVPIKAARERIIAYMIVGPIILTARKDISEYSKEAEKYNIKLEELADALIEINVFSFNKINEVINLIKNLFSHIAQTGYHMKRLGEIKPEVVELDPLFSMYYEEKILSSLLNSCIFALNADSGSVMTLDKKTNMLHIKVASKLDEDVINNTNIRIGEGIAGVAAATAQTIILPQDKDKNNLSEKMKREYIKSSLIVPFNKESAHDIYGVINLNILRRDIEFSKRDIALVKELVKMASIALLPLKESAADPD